MKKYRLTKFAIILTGLSIVACEQKEVKNYLPESNGPLNEVIVVADTDILDGTAGDALKSYLSQRQLGLGVDEAKYTIRHLTPDLFKGAIMRSRSVVYMELDTLYRAHVKKDMYATPQHLVVIKGRNELELSQSVDQIMLQAVDSFRQSDLRVAQSRFKRSLYTEPRLNTTFGIDLTIPSIYLLFHHTFD